MGFKYFFDKLASMMTITSILYFAVLYFKFKTLRN